MNPKHLIFDLDGTLLHFPHDFFISRAHLVFAELGILGLQHHEIRDAFCRFDFFSVCNGQESHSLQEQFWDRFNAEAPPKAEVIFGVHQLFGALRERGLGLSIATARDTAEDKLKLELEELGLLTHISAISSRTDRSVSWRDKREIIRKICRIHEISPGEAVMVGDTPSDILSAKSVGIGWTVAVLTGGIYRSVLESTEPDHILDDVNGILKLL